MGRVHHVRLEFHAGGIAPRERAREAVEAAVLRRRQRDLGLRRQHASRILRRPLSPLRHLHQRAARQSAGEDRERRECRRLSTGPKSCWRRRRGTWTRTRCTTTPCRARWENKGPSTGFPEDAMGLDARTRVAHGRAGDEAFGDHGQVRSGPKRIGLYVDEWGTWYDPEPGRNPAFLYQQNTMRDALVGGAPRCTSSTAMPIACACRTSRRW